MPPPSPMTASVFSQCSYLWLFLMLLFLLKSYFISSFSCIFSFLSHFSFFLLLSLPTPELFISLTYSVSSVLHIFPDLLIPPHKVLTYIEYKAVYGVFLTIDPTAPLHPASVSSHRTKGDSPGGEGAGGQYFGRRHTLDWPLPV